MIEELTEQVQKLAESIAQKDNLDIYACRIIIKNHLMLIDIIVDRINGGITIDECSSINRKIVEQIDEEQLIEDNYEVDVSSPGLDRPLETWKDFRRVIGRRVRFHLLEKIANKVEHTGEVKEVNEKEVRVNTKLDLITIPIAKIQKAMQIIKA